MGNAQPKWVDTPINAEEMPLTGGKTGAPRFAHFPDDMSSSSSGSDDDGQPILGRGGRHEDDDDDDDDDDGQRAAGANAPRVSVIEPDGTIRKLPLPDALLRNREELFRRLPTNKPGTAVVNHLTYRIDLPDGTQKTLLNDLTFHIRPRQMVLILGVPGCGKSTLFKLLANQLKYGEVNGQYFFNDHAPDTRKFHRLVSFVPQDDNHMAAFTVRQTFEFAARCQMPEGTPEHKIQERVQVVMEVLKIDHRAETLVGDNLLRGVSGGEKKRVTIGVEFMKGPGMYLMDEPTTGLDAKTAIDIFQSVRIVADLGPPVLVVLKQPSYELFALFDSVMILTEGSIAYMGPVEKAQPYFERLGYRCPPAMNPVDFLAEVVETPHLYPIPDHELDEQTRLNRPMSAPQFVQAYQASRFHRRQEKAVLSLMPHVISRAVPGPRLLHKDDPEYFAQYPQPLSKQIALCVRRAFQFVGHSPGKMIFRIVKAIIMALFIGSMFWDLTKAYHHNWPYPGQKDALSLQGLMFNVIAFIGFGALAIMPQVITERTVFYQQRANRYYSTFPYFLAGIIVELPIAITESLVYGTIVYWMTGLSSDVGRYFFFLFVNIALSLAMNAYCRFVASASRDFQMANAIAPGGIALMILFAGYIIQGNSIPPWFIWLYWLSPFRYAYEAMTINELSGLIVVCNSSSTNATEYLPPFNTTGYNNASVCPFTLGDQILQQKLDFPANFDARWWNLGILIGFFVLFQLTCYFALRFIRFKPFVNLKAHRAERSEDGPRLIQTGEHQVEGAYLSFLDLNYTVPDPEDTSRDLPLLRNITGYVKPGMLLALMGPSGAGKTTLLDVIANKKTGGVINGSLLFNGQTRDEFFHRFTGYVEQQDMHKKSATIREALQFSALTRLDGNPSRERCFAFAEDVLKILDLEDIADDIVEGLSAEQRKRLTIGVELAADPTLLFLDEPTSGLDAVGALNVMRCVQRAAETGRTIICTIHQPSAKIFSFFSHMLLLKRGGETVYFGPTGENARIMLDYFEEIGFSCPSHRNPADFVLEVSMARENDNQQPVDLGGLWSSTSMARAAHDEVSRGITPAGHAPKRFDRRYAAPFSLQMKETLRRQWTGYMRAVGPSAMRIIRQIVVGLLLGFLFFQLPRDQLGATTTVGLIFFAVLFANLGALAAIPGFFEDRATFYRERDSGNYYSITYLASVIIADLPFVIAGAVAFTVSMFFLVGLELGPGGGRFFFFLLNYLGAMLASLGLAQLSAVVSPAAEVANAIAALIISLFSLSAGFLLARDLIPPYWIWLYWLSFVRYPLESLTVNANQGVPYRCTFDEKLWIPIGQTQLKPYCAVTCGDTIIDYFDMKIGLKWIDVGVLYAYWLLLIVATWACLQWLKQIKR